MKVFFPRVRVIPVGDSALSGLSVGSLLVGNHKLEAFAMLRITYKSFEPCLRQWFTNTGDFRSMADFKTYAYSLFSGRWAIVRVERV